MASTTPTTNAPENASGHRQPGETCAREAEVPVSQGTNSVHGTWCSEGEAGRHLRTKAGQAGTTPAGLGTPSPMPIPLRLERIATQAQQYPDMAFTTLAHHLDVAMLGRAFQSLNPHSAPGADRVTWQKYKENLATNLEVLHEKLVNGTYCPQPVVRRLIPKSNGKLRPLGLPALEDKIVAKAVAMLLEAIYEQDFCDASYGFRPGRSPHQALHEVRQGMLKNGIGYVIDCDISAFFDNLQHDTLLTILRKRIKDGRVLELIEMWLKAGILDGKEMVFPDKGSPQGSVISPLLANVYLHEVLDTWCETVVQAHCRGKVVLYRYADDVVIGCEREEDARRISEVLPKRFAKYGLEINTEKTKVVRFGRPQRSSADRQAGTFSFLGFVHYWGKTWRGSHTIKRKTEGKRLRRSLGAFWRWCRDNRHRPLQEQYTLLCAKLRGYYQYYGIRCNSQCLDLVYYAATRAWRYWLNRRGGRKMTWRAFGRMMAAYPLPRPKIVKGWV
jgi:RNA-directed DNA polymerase